MDLVRPVRLSSCCGCLPHLGKSMTLSDLASANWFIVSPRLPRRQHAAQHAQAVTLT
jgi:hypothetical protein